MSMAMSFRRACLAAALASAAAMAGCISMEDRMKRTEEGGAFSEGLQAVLMINQTEIRRGRPLILQFAIKNGSTKEVRVAKKITRDSGWAGLVLIGPEGSKPPFQDVLIDQTYLRHKETVLLRTGDIHHVQWILTGEETRSLMPGYHSLRAVYKGIRNTNPACDNWWVGRVESNAKFISVK